MDYKNINKFFYLKCNGNFGDYINKIFLSKLLNRNLIFSDKHDQIHYVTTGSVLTKINNKSIVWGTGFISENSNLGGNHLSNKNKVIKKPLKIISVRGPLTRQKLINMGIECPKKYGDPLILFPLIYNNFTIKNTYKYGIIPHFIDKNNDNLKILINNLNNEAKIIDIIIINDNYKRFIDEILSCEYIISSSLHGVIMGIIYRKKTIFVEFSNNVIGNKFKFYDFFKSLNINYNVKNDYTINLLKNVINVNYNNVYKLTIEMIQHCPFILNKNIMLKTYKSFVKNIN